MPQPRTAYPPGHPRRVRIRATLQKLGSTSVRINFESRGQRYALQSYGLTPVRRKLAAADAGELQAVAIAVLRAALPPTPVSRREARPAGLAAGRRPNGDRLLKGRQPAALPPVEGRLNVRRPLLLLVRPLPYFTVSRMNAFSSGCSCR